MVGNGPIRININDMKRMTFNFTSPELATKLALLANIYNTTKTKVVCDLIEHEFDSVMMFSAIESVTKEINETIS
jgi:hypothetical protein